MAAPNYFGNTATAGLTQGQPGGSFGELYSEYQKAHNAAVAANEARYKDILGGYGTRYDTLMQDQSQRQLALDAGYQQRYDRVMQGLEGIGQSQRQDLADQFTRARSSAMQSGISRGLGNTTITDSVQRGIGSDEAKAKIALQDTLTRERMGFDSMLSGDKLQAQGLGNAQALGLGSQLSSDILQFKERRTDDYPDPNMFLQLAQMAGGAGGGGAGGAGGGMGGGGDGQPFYFNGQFLGYMAYDDYGNQLGYYQTKQGAEAARKQVSSDRDRIYNPNIGWPTYSGQRRI